MLLFIKHNYNAKTFYNSIKKHLFLLLNRIKTMNFKNLKLLLIFSFILNSVSYSQKKYDISITSEANPVAFPYTYIKNSNIIKYGNKEGKLTINSNSESDTLRIECNGYLPKEIPLQNQSENLSIILEPSTEILEEIVISVHNNEKSKWQKINKKTKKTFETEYFGIFEGSHIISSYKIETVTKFNGIRFFVITNEVGKDFLFNKKVRPILIINSENLSDNMLPNKIIYFEKDAQLYTKLDIEFKNTVTLIPDDTLTIGIELIPENSENPNMKNVIGVLTTKHLLKESKTVTNNYLSKTQKTAHLNQDIYFELKMIK